MASNFSVYKLCPRCNGSGEVSIDDQPYDPNGGGSTIICPRCNGEKKFLWGIMVKEE